MVQGLYSAILGGFNCIVKYWVGLLGISDTPWLVPFAGTGHGYYSRTAAVEAKEGRGKASQAYPLDMVCSLTKSMPGQANPPRIYVAEGGGKLRGDSR